MLIDQLPVRLMCGDLAIDLLGAKVEKAKALNRRTAGDPRSLWPISTSGEDYFGFQVRLTNTSVNRITEYGGDYSFQLTDNHGNRYGRYTNLNLFGPLSGPIRPGDSRSGLVVFDPPLPNISHVTLAMPGKALDCPDGLAIQVPAQLIER